MVKKLTLSADETIVTRRSDSLPIRKPASLPYLTASYAQSAIPRIHIHPWDDSRKKPPASSNPAGAKRIANSLKTPFFKNTGCDP